MDNTSLLTAIYDLENVFTEDIELIKNLIQPSDSCLELGCGTGRVCNQLISEGLKVDGLDISLEAISILKSKLPESYQKRTDFFVSDMSNFKIDKKYDFIFSVFNSFMLLTKFEQQQDCLSCIHKHLAPGGRLLLSTSNPCLERMNEKFSYLKHQKTLVNPMTNNKIEKFEYNHFDLDKQLIHRAFTYDETDNGVVRRHTNKFTVRYLFKYEFILMLEKAGFKILETFGDWDMSCLTQKSPSIIMLAQKV
jgi:SAM-dependent methyltransferase